MARIWRFLVLLANILSSKAATTAAPPIIVATTKIRETAAAEQLLVAVINGARRTAGSSLVIVEVEQMADNIKKITSALKIAQKASFKMGVFPHDEEKRLVEEAQEKEKQSIIEAQEKKKQLMIETQEEKKGLIKNLEIIEIELELAKKTNDKSGITKDIYPEEEEQLFEKVEIEIAKNIKKIASSRESATKVNAMLKSLATEIEENKTKIGSHNIKIYLQKIKDIFSNNTVDELTTHRNYINTIFSESVEPEENISNVFEKWYKFLAHDVLKISISKKTWQFIAENKNNESKLIEYFHENYKLVDRTGWGGSISDDDFKTVIKVINKIFDIINKNFELVDKENTGFIFVTNTIGESVL